jgi:hypothetical protein
LDSSLSIESFIPGNCLTHADDIVARSNSASGAFDGWGAGAAIEGDVAVSGACDCMVLELQEINGKQSTVTIASTVLFLKTYSSRLQIIHKYANLTTGYG